MQYFDQAQVAVVTGSGSGIGRACAQIFAREGARVIVSDINEGGGHETVRMVEAAGGKAAFRAANVADPASLEALMQFAVDTYGGLHAVVNNAGIGGEPAATADASLEAWNKIIAINQSGVFYGMKYAIPHMLKSGGGAIVNIASILGTVGFANSVGYVASKHAVVGMTRTAALEYSASGVRINAVGPGFIETAILAGLDEYGPDAREMITRMHPIGRMGQAEEVAEMVVWLCSPRASFCTGTYYAVDGGYLAQ